MNQADLLRASGATLGPDAVNAAHHAPTRCRAIGERRFRVKGEEVPLGAEIELPWHVAIELRAIGKVEILNADGT